jgi:CBS domain-containing protein
MGAKYPARLAGHPDWWRVRDVMTTHVVRAAPAMTYAEVVDLLLAHGISGLPVTDAAGRLLGIVTEADLVRHDAGRASVPAGRPTDAPVSGETAAELMTCPVVTAEPDDDLPTTACKLLDSGYRRLPVVATDGSLVGIVSRRDLLTPAWEDASGEG